jgi:hypothetical protein
MNHYLMKLILLLSSLVFSLESASGVVFLFEPNPGLTHATFAFDDTLSGGYSESVFAPIVPPNSGIWHTMNYPGYLVYSSAGPHVDSASLSLDITQAGGVPWFAANGSLSQSANLAGDMANMSVQFSSYFEGTMTGTSLAAALGSMSYNVSGVVSAHAGSYVNLNAQSYFYDHLGNFVASLGWSYSNVTPGAFSATVTPTILSSGLFLTDNLITVNGFITLQADPSSISITPVPEPSSFVFLLLGAAVLPVFRKRQV